MFYYIWIANNGQHREREIKMRYDTRNIIGQAKLELDDRIKEIQEEKGKDIDLTLPLEEHYIDDIIHEIADNNVPIYTYDLLQYASNNFDLLQPNDLAGDNPNVDKIIQSNIYEILMEDLYEYLNERKEENEK